MKLFAILLSSVVALSFAHGEEPVAVALSENIMAWELQPRDWDCEEQEASLSPEEYKQWLSSYPAEKLAGAIKRVLLDRYVMDNGLIATDQELEAYLQGQKGNPELLADDFGNAFFSEIIESQKVGKSLFKKYGGGRVSISSLGFVVPIDAQVHFLKEQKADGAFSIADKQMEAAFWEQVAKEWGDATLSEDEAREMFNRPDYLPAKKPVRPTPPAADGVKPDARSTQLVEVASGDTNFMMRIMELERNANTSKLKLTYKKMGSSVGSSLFIGSAFYEIAKARGVEYYATLKEWDAPEGGYFYIGGFTDDNTTGIQEQFGMEFDPTNRWGKPIEYLRVSDMNILFERPPVKDPEAQAARNEHRQKIRQGDLTAATNGLERFEALCHAVKNAARAGKPTEVREQAEELLRLAPTYKRHSMYGNAIQDANQALGQIALADGHLAEAKQCLLASADSDGSPTMNSFGPNMTLARELLRQGETEVVLQYFERCRVFWNRHADTLDQWTEEVQTGRIPDFGANLVY